MVDTGCENNHLYGTMKDLLHPECFFSHSKRQVSSVNGIIESEKVRMPFKLGNKVFEEKFLLIDKQSYVKIDGQIVVGILGLPFLMKHGLTIDFFNSVLHSKDVDYEELENKNIGYNIDLYDGIQFFHMPVFMISDGENDLLAGIDTGAVMNGITQKALNHYSFSPTVIANECALLTVVGVSAAKSVEMDYYLSLYSEEQKQQILYRDIFIASDVDCFKKIIPQDGMPSEGLPVIEALIGSEFMRREGWVLDFKYNRLFLPMDKKRFKEYLKKAE